MSQYDPNVNLAMACVRIHARAKEASNRRLRDVSRRTPEDVEPIATHVANEGRSRSIETQSGRSDESLVGSQR